MWITRAAPISLILRAAAPYSLRFRSQQITTPAQERAGASASTRQEPSHQFTAGSLLLWEQAAFFKMSNQQSFNIGRHRTVILLRRQFDSALRLVRHSYGYRRCFCHEFTCVQLTFNFIVFRLNSLAHKCNGLRGRL